MILAKSLLISIPQRLPHRIATLTGGAGASEVVNSAVGRDFMIFFSIPAGHQVRKAKTGLDEQTHG